MFVEFIMTTLAVFLGSILACVAVGAIVYSDWFMNKIFNWSVKKSQQMVEEFVEKDVL